MFCFSYIFSDNQSQFRGVGLIDWSGESSFYTLRDSDDPRAHTYKGTENTMVEVVDPIRSSVIFSTQPYYYPFYFLQNQYTAVNRHHSGVGDYDSDGKKDFICLSVDPYDDSQSVFFILSNDNHSTGGLGIFDGLKKENLYGLFSVDVNLDGAMDVSVVSIDGRKVRVMVGTPGSNELGWLYGWHYGYSPFEITLSFDVKGAFYIQPEDNVRPFLFIYGESMYVLCQFQGTLYQGTTLYSSGTFPSDIIEAYPLRLSENHALQDYECMIFTKSKKFCAIDLYSSSSSEEIQIFDIADIVEIVGDYGVTPSNEKGVAEVQTVFFPEYFENRVAIWYQYPLEKRGFLAFFRIDETNPLGEGVFVYDTDKFPIDSETAPQFVVYSPSIAESNDMDQGHWAVVFDQDLSCY